LLLRNQKTKLKVKIGGKTKLSVKKPKTKLKVKIGGKAKVGGKLRIGGKAKVGGKIKISGKAKVGGKITTKKIITMFSTFLGKIQKKSCNHCQSPIKNLYENFIEVGY